MLFQTERIAFRKITEQDIALYHTWRNDLEVMQTTSPALDVYSSKETEDFVTQVILRSDAAKSYMIVEKIVDRPIGIISLIHIDYKNRNAECIIDIGEKQAWGKGYGTEAMKLLLNYGFLEMNLHRICLRVFSFNERAVQLYKKVGFQTEGVSKESLFRHGRWHDTIHMAILQRDYLRTRMSDGAADDSI